MIIKVCGMTQPANIVEAAEAGADWIGLVFYPRSPRYVCKETAVAGLTPCRANLPSMAAGVEMAGVFVDATPRYIAAQVARFGLDIVQLHGNEPPAMLRQLRRLLDGAAKPGIKIVKAVSISSGDDMARSANYADSADLLLFDTRCKGVGGSGRQFDWAVLDSYQGPLPFILSGGIGPGDAEGVAAISHPKLAGVDLNSRFETAPGIKDIALVRHFITRLRELTQTQN